MQILLIFIRAHNPIGALMILIVGCDDIWLRGPGLEEEFDEISVF